MRQQPFRLGPRGRWWFDVVLAGALLAPVVVMPVAYDLVTFAFCLLEIVPLFWRRSHPRAVFVAVAGVSALQALALDLPTWGQVAFPVALYSLARFGDSRSALAGLMVGFAGAFVGSWVWLSGWDALNYGAMVSYLMTIGTIVIAAWALGTLGRTRQAYVDALEQRHLQLLQDAEQRAALAAADERARIAREMHDVVAHGLSMIIVQADGARYAARTDPSIAPPVLDTIATAGREALTEMRRLLGLLRSGDGADGARPQPRLGDLHELVAEARAAGMRVEAALPGTDVVVDAGVGLTVYRLVQEALNNVRRHAGPGAAARVSVAAAPDALEVEVIDDGRGAAAEGDGRGLGLVGMRERVATHGGELETGPLVGGGWRVRARLPR